MSIFTDIYVKPPRRSKQVLDHPVLTTTDFGKIIPVLVEDVVPGDIFKCKTAAEIKLFPTLAPLRQGIEVRIDYFFVPNRLLWDSWQEFITGGEDGTAAPVHPFVNSQAVSKSIKSLWDYFGLPANVVRNSTPLTCGDLDVDAMPFRAYSLIWNEYYRDQNLQEPVDISLASGEDTDTNTDLLYRGYKKDYFTSALPWTQRGPQVTIPLAGEAPVTGEAAAYNGVTDNNAAFIPVGGWLDDSEPNEVTVVPDGQAGILKTSPGYGSRQLDHLHSMSIPKRNVTGSADLSDASAVTINELRRLSSVQKWLERNARAGSRYVEQILAHFGIRTPDYRLDRPEYIGGGKQTIGMAEIFQTSQTDSTPQGTRSGVGYGNMLASTRRFKVDEHGWILGLMSIVPQHNIYSDGIHRRWTRETKFDYYFPEFQNLGEQAILNKEIFAYDERNYDLSGTFGYTPRHAEYRYHPGVVTGEMRQSMSYWHMARLWRAHPSLNANFIDIGSSLSQFDRLFPTDETLGDRFVVYMQHYERMKRPMQKNPNPSL